MEVIKISEIENLKNITKSINHILELETDIMKYESEISNKLDKCSRTQLEYANAKRDLAQTYQKYSEIMIKLIDLKKLFKADKLLGILDDEIGRLRTNIFQKMKISEAEIDVTEALINSSEKIKILAGIKNKIAKIYKDIVKDRKNQLRKVSELIKAKEDFEKYKDGTDKEINLEENIKKKQIDLENTVKKMVESIKILLIENENLENLERELSDLDEIVSKRLDVLNKIRSPEIV